MSAVCSEAPHSQFGEGARPHLCMDEWNRPTPVRRRLNSCQLINCFEGMKSMVTSYQVLEASFLSNASHLDLKVEARKFSNKFSDNVFPFFPSQMLSIKTLFREKIAHLKSAEEIASFLIVGNASLATIYLDVCTTYMMYMTVPVIVATVEKSFSKLKLIKNFLQSSMSQERLSVWLCY